MNRHISLALLLCIASCGESSDATQPLTGNFESRVYAQAPEGEEAAFPESIPIFIITCDRLTVTKKAIESFYREIAHPVEIIIHDNASTFPPFLKYLDDLENSGVTVVRNPKGADHAAMLNGVRTTINNWYRDHDAPYYIVTDPDIELEPGPGDILQFYGHLLRVHPAAEVVGPMLRIDDIPDVYPLKGEVIRRHTDQFWHKRPTPVQWQGEGASFQSATVDTTFGMYRKGYAFHRLSVGFRTYAPYQARHLDWYLDPQKLEDDQAYYIAHASDVSHWGGAWLRSKIEH